MFDPKYSNMKHTHILYPILILGLAFCLTACDTNQNHAADEESDSLTEEVVDTNMGEAQAQFEELIDTTSKSISTEGMKKADMTEVKEVTINPCTEVQKKEMAKWRDEITTYQEVLKEVTDPDEKMGITQSLNDAKKELEKLIKIYNCTE